MGHVEQLLLLYLVETLLQISSVDNGMVLAKGGTKVGVYRREKKGRASG
jgi:hypothetical protein